MADELVTDQAAILDAIACAAHLRDNRHAWENEVETVFEIFRRTCRICARGAQLENLACEDKQLEEAWCFLVEVRRRKPIYKKRVYECGRALGTSCRWLDVLHKSNVVLEALDALNEDARQELLAAIDPLRESCNGAANGEVDLPHAVESQKFDKPVAVSSPWPQVNLDASSVPSTTLPLNQRPGNPFLTVQTNDHSPGDKFASMSPKAREGRQALVAAIETSPKARAPGRKKSGGCIAVQLGWQPAQQMHNIQVADLRRNPFVEPRRNPFASADGCTDFNRGANTASPRPAFTGQESSFPSQAAEANRRQGVADKLGQAVSSAASKTRDFEQRHQVTARLADGGRNAFVAAREKNAKYGITDKIGQGLSTAFQKTREFEQRHQVTNRTMDAGRHAIVAAKDTNEKHGITDKIGQSVSTAVSKTREFERKHQVTSKVADAGSKGFEKARGFEERHQVTSRVTSGISSGISKVASSATAYAGSPRQQSANPFVQRDGMQPKPTAMPQRRNPFAQS